MALSGIPFLEGKYSPTLDIWPIEAPQFNRIHTFYENLREGNFTTTKCKQCGKVAYPPRVICPECYSDELEWIELPKKGKVLTATEKYVGVPLCYEPPLIDAWIDMGEDSPVRRLLSRMINCEPGTLKEGDEVQLVVFDVPSHPIEIKKETITAERVFFAFEPVNK
ncbi:Zn-ribbon domain-containing OB-fold protein [Chloroflexota bacterium]